VSTKCAIVSALGSSDERPANASPPLIFIADEDNVETARGKKYGINGEHFDYAIARHRTYWKNVAREMNLPSRWDHREQMNLIIRQRRNDYPRMSNIYEHFWINSSARWIFKRATAAALHNAIYRASRPST